MSAPMRVPLRQIIPISLSLLVLASACSYVVPDAKATEARIYANVLATITASAPTVTPTDSPLAAFAWAYAAPMPTSSSTPIFTATPDATPTATSTPKPTELQFTGFDETQLKVVKGGLEYLKNCKPAYYDSARTQISEIALGDDSAGSVYYFSYGQPVLYLPPRSDVFNAYRYDETSRRYVMAVLVAHAGKRLEIGDDTGLAGASRVALEILDTCKPKQSDTDPNAAWLYQALQEWLEEMAATGCAQGCLYHKTGCDIKGEIYIEWNDKVYYVPTSKAYGAVVMDDTYSHRWFCTEDEATAAGWRKAGQ